MKTIFDLVKDQIGDKPIWNYIIYPPLSFDDSAQVQIFIQYGKTKIESYETLTLPIGEV